MISRKNHDFDTRKEYAGKVHGLLSHNDHVFHNEQFYLYSSAYISFLPVDQL